jgi:hypothetical protein
VALETLQAKDDINGLQPIEEAVASGGTERKQRVKLPGL